MIHQFHEFFDLILGGFLTFGPTVYGSEDLQQSYSSLNSKKNVVRSILNCHGKTVLSNGTLTLRMPFKLTSPSAAVCNEIESQTVHQNLEKCSRNKYLG
jgi:hypothetical protein